MTPDAAAYAPLGGAAAERPRTLGAFGVAVVCFAAVAGGPFGIEPAVGAAGGLPTLLAIVLAALAWAGPQAIMVAELSTMMPSNAGYIEWCICGLGPLAGFLNAHICNCQQLLNIPLYAVLACNAIEQLVGALPPAAEYGIKLAVVALAGAVNLLGVAAVERVTGALVLLVQTPFVLMPILWAAGVRGGAGPRPFAWRALGASVAGWEGNATTFLSTVVWNLQGWSVMGNVAGEVADPTRNIPAGVFLAVALTAANYVWPLVFTIAMSPPPSPPDDPARADARWGAGYFVGLAAQASPALGAWAAVCAVLSCLANFIPVLATASRALQATARLRMVPGPAALTRLLAFEDAARGGVPSGSVAAILAAVLGLMLLNFETLVTTQILLALVGLCLQFGAFLRLKHRAPGAARPYAVPGGAAGAWALAAPFFALAGVIVYANAAGSAQNLVSFCAVAALAGALALAGECWWVRRVYSAELVEGVLGRAGAAAAAAAAAAAEGAEGEGAALARAGAEEGGL